MKVLISCLLLSFSLFLDSSPGGYSAPGKSSLKEPIEETDVFYRFEIGVNTEGRRYLKVEWATKQGTDFAIYYEDQSKENFRTFLDQVNFLTTNKVSFQVKYDGEGTKKVLQALKWAQ